MCIWLKTSILFKIFPFFYYIYIFFIFQSSSETVAFLFYTQDTAMHNLEFKKYIASTTI